VRSASPPKARGKQKADPRTAGVREGIGGDMSTATEKSKMEQLNAMVHEFGRPDVQIAADEKISPYVPFFPNVYIRHLAFDVRNNYYVNVLWVKQGGMLGRHRHRGVVTACTLEGSWRYLEYDWVARPGSYVRESPGVTHTLMSDEGMKTMFFMNGSLEFYDEQDNVTDTLDVFWFIHHYVTYCREKGIPLNEKLWV
jgi:2,4'-dihydroxyacetophenone dioxygenase